MDSSRQIRVRQAFDDFFAPGEPKSGSWVLDLFQRTVKTVPAYRKLLRDNGIEPAAIRTFEDFQRLPLLDKANYHERYPLPELCLDRKLENCDMIAVSSGSRRCLAISFDERRGRAIRGRCRRDGLIPGVSGRCGDAVRGSLGRHYRPTELPDAA